MLLGLVIIALTFLAKPWIGVLIAVIILYDYCKHKKEQTKIQKEKDTWPKICSRPGTTPDQLLMYKGCTVEIFKNLKVTRVIKPDGKDLGASFKDAGDAIKSIDEHVE